MKLEKDKKWKWPAEKMRDWTDAELKTREREFSDQLFRLKFQMAGGQSEHVTAVRELRAGGGTALYDTIFFACKEKMLFFPAPEPYLRRVLIIISDGQDNQSEHTREEALAMAQRGEVIIFAISTNRSGITGSGDEVLKRLAQETGGRAFFPFAASDLAANFEEIGRDLRSQYTLAYVSANQNRDGTFRNISVRTRAKDLNVRAKRGYFAPTK